MQHQEDVYYQLPDEHPGLADYLSFAASLEDDHSNQMMHVANGMQSSISTMGGRQFDSQAMSAMRAPSEQDFMSPLDTPSSAIIWEDMGLPGNDIFTPLVSPAVGPSDASYINTPGGSRHGSIASSGFSPLLSPAITGNHHSYMRDNRQEKQGGSDKGRPSPSTKKARSQTTPKALRSVRASPLMKAQRKKQPSSSSASAVSLVTVPQSEVSLHGVSSESISPEALADLLMAPPAPPKPNPTSSTSTAKPKHAPPPSADASPAMTEVSFSPATPASLMNMPKNMPFSLDTSQRGSTGGFALPLQMDLDGGKQWGEKYYSGVQIAPDSTPPTPAMGEQRQKAVESAKKRGVISSVDASPALQPRISPCIPPMYGNGDQNDIGAMLAAKSNYQNIVEGNHSQLGLQYPEALATGLTSKKTSHKLAEQERRNRISSAIVEIAQLLPPNLTSGSKANTVEMAIDYIRDLQKQLQTTQEDLNRANDLLQNR